MKQYYKKDGKVYQLMMATTKERIAQIKSSEEGYFIDNDKIYICSNKEYHLEDTIIPIFHLTRVSYRKKDTPIKNREYYLKEINGTVVGTVDEWKDYLSKHNSDFELVVENDN